MELNQFLTNQTFLTQEEEIWGGMPLQIRAYLASDLPPIKYISSVRCVVTRGQEVLVFRNPAGNHIVPGGRIEAGESLLEALQRELDEEGGCTIGTPQLLGFVHFFHKSPKPNDYPHPYPEFVQVVYQAEVIAFQLNQKRADDFEEHAEFLPIEIVRQMTLAASDHLFLNAISP